MTEFPDLFEKIIHQPRDDIFEACLDNRGNDLREGQTDLAEFIVYHRCDVSKLTPDRLQALSHEWEALAAFKDELNQAAKSLPSIIVDKRRRVERLNDAVARVFDKWNDSRSNLSTFTRALFGKDVVEAPVKFIEKIAESAFGPATTGALVGGLDGKTILGAGIGLVIGVIVHAGRTYTQLTEGEKNSPYRYLTLMEKNGVGFTFSA